MANASTASTTSTPSSVTPPLQLYTPAALPQQQRPASWQELRRQPRGEETSRPASGGALQPPAEASSAATSVSTTPPRRHLQFGSHQGWRSPAVGPSSSLSSPRPLSAQSVGSQGEPSSLSAEGVQTGGRGAALAVQPTLNCALQRPAASEVLLEAQAGVLEAEVAVQQAHQQRQQLWQLADRLVANQRGRAREAERQLWEVHYDARRALQAAVAAQAEAEMHAGVVEAAEATARQAQQQVDALQQQVEGEKNKVSRLQGTADSLRQQLEEAEQELQEQREGSQGQLAALVAQVQEQRQLAASANQQVARLHERLAGVQQQLEQEERLREEAQEQLRRAGKEAAAKEQELLRCWEQEQQAAAALCQNVEQASVAQRQLELQNGSLRQEVLSAKEDAVAAAAQCAAEQQLRQRAEGERLALLERLQEVDGHLEALAADCRSLATTQQAAEEVRAAAEAAMQEQAQALAQVEQQLRVVTEQAAVQQALLRDRTSSLEEQRAAAFLLETELQEAAAVADACQQEAAALRLSLRLESRDKTKALEQLQVAHTELHGLRTDYGVLEGRMRCIEGSEEACREQELSELEQLVALIEGAVPKLRNIVTERRIEAARSELEASAANQSTCGICWTNQRDTFLNCGHLICRPCSERLTACPVCWAGITSRSRVFV